jgi:hypothetical protein
MQPNGEHYQRARTTVVDLVDEYGRSLVRNPGQFTSVPGGIDGSSPERSPRRWS